MDKIIVISKEDFDIFKQELLNEIKILFENNIKNNQTKIQWMRSKDVREMLGISDAKLQTMRINKTIPAYYLDGSWFYKYEEITDAIEKGKVK